MASNLPGKAMIASITRINAASTQSAAETGDGADRNAKKGAEKNRAHGHFKSCPRAEHNSAVGVPPQGIGSEPMLTARDFQTIGDVDLVGVMSGQIGCEQCRHEPCADDNQSQKRQAITDDDTARVEKPRKM